jgi:DNA-binding MarR family transcriptional regulator
MLTNRPTAPGASDTHRLVQLLCQAEHSVRRELARALEAEGSTIEQWRALSLLSDGKAHAMSEIADHAMMAAPTLTRLIDRMVADTLAYRTADPSDRRRVLVHATPAGQALHRQLARCIEAGRDRILADAAPDDIAELAALLADLSDGRR